MAPPMMQQGGYGQMPPGPYGGPMDPNMGGSPVVLASRLNEEVRTSSTRPVGSALARRVTADPPTAPR